MVSNATNDKAVDLHVQSETQFKTPGESEDLNTASENDGSVELQSDTQTETLAKSENLNDGVEDDRTVVTASLQNGAEKQERLTRKGKRRGYYRGQYWIPVNYIIQT